MYYFTHRVLCLKKSKDILSATNPLTLLIHNNNQQHRHFGIMNPHHCPFMLQMRTGYQYQYNYNIIKSHILYDHTVNKTLKLISLKVTKYIYYLAKSVTLIVLYILNLQNTYQSVIIIQSKNTQFFAWSILCIL